jgi:cytochrome c
MPKLLARALLLATVVLPHPLAADPMPGDARRGERIYDRCMACHSIERDRTGPRHEGLIGRRVGGVQGFSYSAAMKKAGAAGMVWDEETLGKFLQNPIKFLPGTRMGYAGVKDAQERADLIAFLKEHSSPRSTTHVIDRDPGAPRP